MQIPAHSFGPLPQNLAWLRRMAAQPAYLANSLEELAVDQLFEQSVKCAPNEGHKDLIMNAAKALVRRAEAALRALAELEGRVFEWTAYGCDRCAAELAETLFRDPAVRTLVEDRLRSHVDAILSDERFTHDDPNIVALEWNFEAKSSSRKKSSLSKHPMTDIVRTLEYLDGIKGEPDYRRLLPLKRALTIMFRVGSAALGRSY